MVGHKPFLAEPAPAFVRGIDVASYQPADLSALIAEHQAKHVVVRLYLPFEGPPQQYSLDQIASALANGCTVGGYMWCYATAGPRESVLAAIQLARQAGLALKVLWLDIEPYTDGTIPDAYWLANAVDECRVHGIQPGIYTGCWVVNAHPWLGKITDCLLWLAAYNHIADLDSVEVCGDWDKAMVKGHQYSEDGIDLDVFAPEVT